MRWLKKDETNSAEKLESTLRRGRSPFTAKSVLLAGALFLGAGYVTVAEPGKESVLSGLQALGPGTMALTGSFLGGYFIGWGARRTVKLTAMIAAAVAGFIGLTAYLGWDGSQLQQGVNAGVGWLGENIEGAGRYLVGLLPSASAAGAGGVLGYRRS
jgi:hypothetical protein